MIYGKYKSNQSVCTKHNKSVGPSGPEGEPGPTGERGPIGFTGRTGARGPKGGEGHIGPKGDKGHTGDAGRDGSSIIIQGYAHIQEIYKKSGHSGDVWIAKIVDPVDPFYYLNGHGLMSSGLGTGKDNWFDLGRLQGDKGERGHPGSDGSDGATGKAGADGKDGVDGKHGLDSIVPGPKGDTGSVGSSGKDGSSIFVNGTAPISTILSLRNEEIGSMWIASNTDPSASVPGKEGDGYVWMKKGLAWKNIGSLRGPQGIPGPKGDMGDQGKNGLDGLDGKNGADGADGGPGGPGGPTGGCKDVVMPNASATTVGGIKIRVSGSKVYITTDGSNP